MGFLLEQIFLCINGWGDNCTVITKTGGDIGAFILSAPLQLLYNPENPLFYCLQSDRIEKSFVKRIYSSDNS